MYPYQRVHVPVCIACLQYLDQIKTMVLENLRILDHAPSVQMQVIPAPLLDTEKTDETDPDQRESEVDAEKRVVPDNEYYAASGDQDSDVFVAS